MRLETRHLRYFVAVAEELHFGRAASRLHISQPPLSQQIRQLEEDIGTRLFERTQRSVRLTHAGEILLVQARQILSDLEEAVSLVQASARGEGGFLRLGYTAASAYAYLPPLLNAFKQRYPGVEVYLNEQLSGQQILNLQEGRLDVGLVRPPIDEADLSSEKLIEEALVVAMHVDHPLASHRIIDVKDLHDVPFIAFTPTAARYFHDMVETLFSNAGVQPKVVQHATQPHTVVALVSAGLGLALVPHSSVRVHMDHVTYRPLHARKPPHAEMHLCWKKHTDSPLVKNFLEVAREVASQYLQD